MKKKITQYEQEPLQVDLFNYYGIKTKYSNTIELYESMPKYFYGMQKRSIAKDIKAEILPILERSFVFRERNYKLSVIPAKIKDDKTGITKEYYPSKREEIVEDILKKMAFQGRGIYFDDLFGIMFSLREIEQELKEYGHRSKRSEIRQAILINSRATLSVVSEDNKIQLESHFFETAILGQKVQKGAKVSNEQYTLVRFNTLVTKSIKDKTLRNINIDTCLQYDNPVARYLHKRISHHFQADKFGTRAFRMKLSTIVNDSGMPKSKTLRKDFERVKEAIEEMQEIQSIAKFTMEKMYAEKPKNKIVDYMVYIIPSSTFTSEIIQANKESNRIKALPSN